MPSQGKVYKYPSKELDVKELQSQSLEKCVKRILFKRFIPSAIVIAVLSAFILSIIIMKAMSGPFQTKDIPGYAFLGLLILGGTIVSGIALQQIRIYLNLLSSTLPQKRKLRFPNSNMHGKSLRTIEVLDEANQNSVSAFIIIASTHEDLKEFPQLCDFEVYLNEQGGKERAIFSRTNYALIAYRHTKRHGPD